MVETLFDTNPVGNFFVPNEVIEILISLVSPLRGENVLDINLNPDTALKLLTDKTGVRARYLRSNTTTEELAQAEQLFDVILCGPTFGNAYRSPDGSNEPIEEFWLKWCLNHLASKGRLAIIMPTGLLSNHSQQNIRKFLISQKGLQAIIELPTGWTQLTASQASIIFITKTDNLTQKVKMLRFAKGQPTSWISQVSYLVDDAVDLDTARIDGAFSIPVSDLDYRRLDVQYYHSKLEMLPIPEPSIFTEFLLADLVKIRSGERFSKEDFQANGVPFVQVRNVTSKGTIDLKNIQTLVPEIAVQSRGYCILGDIIITTAGTLGKVALLDSHFSDIGICIDTSLRRLQIPDTKFVSPEYLAIYLRTPLAQQQIKQLVSGTVIPVLSGPNLSELKVYLPKLEKQLEILSIFANSELSYEEKFQISFYAKPLQPEPPKPVYKQPLIIEDEHLSLDDIVQKQLPFPIARSFTLFIDSNYQPGNIRVKALIDLSESIIYYMYNVLVSDQIRRLKIDDEDLKSKMNISFIHYSVTRRLDVIFRILKLARKDSSIDLFIPELLNINLGVCSEIQNKVRNELSHNTAFPENKCRQIIKEYQPKLEKLLDSLKFIKDYNLTQVVHITVRNSRLQHRIISMMGNNSLFKPEIADLEKENILLADSLHVILIAKARGYDFLDLHPFYLTYAWEKTGEYDHLCFLKHVVGNPPQQLKVESTQGVNDTTTETDMEFNDIISF